MPSALFVTWPWWPKTLPVPPFPGATADAGTEGGSAYATVEGATVATGAEAGAPTQGQIRISPAAASAAC